EHPVGDHVRVEATAGGNEHDVEHLEDHDEDRGGHGDDGAANRRDDHPSEDLQLGGAVDSGRLHQFLGYAFDGGGEDHHRKAGLEPDHDQDQHQRVEGWALEEGD